MRGTSSVWVFTVGAVATAHAVSPRSLIERLEPRAVGVRNDEGAGAQLVAVDVEVVFGGKHLDVAIAEPESHQSVVGGVVDDHHGAAAFDASGRLRIGREHGHGMIEDSLVGHRRQLHVAHVLHGPTGVVVGARIGRRIILHAEVHVGERAIGLIGADDIVARGDVDGAGLEGGAGLLNFKTLAPQVVHHLGGVGLAPLAGGNDPRVGRTGLALLDRALVLQPVVLEIQLLRFLPTWFMARSSADSWMLVLLRGPHLMEGSGGFGRNHSRLVTVGCSRRLSTMSGP